MAEGEHPNLFKTQILKAGWEILDRAWHCPTCVAVLQAPKDVREREDHEGNLP